MADTLLRRARSESGLTLLELLIVLIVMAILIAIAVPAYLKFTERANDSAAAANLRAVLPAVAAFKADNDDAGGYAQLRIATLKSTYDSGIVDWDAARGTGVTVLSKSANTYCIESVAGGSTYYQAGPGQPIVTSPACT